VSERRAPSPKRVVVLVPCFNEEKAVGDVVRQFREELPDAAIWVFDNNSTDGTVAAARAAGASVAFERRQGKGYVVQTMFRKVDADVYVLVDGDGTYPASEVRKLLAPVLAGEADMVIASRLHIGSSSEFQRRNRFGNVLFRRLLNSIFHVRLTDLLSGYRVFSRRLVRGVPLFGGGFETEAEMTIRALERGFVVEEMPCDLRQRPAGSHSKIRIVQDGLLILRTILTLYRDNRPLAFFSWLGVTAIALAFVPGAWVLADFLRTGQVLRLPSAIVAVGLGLTGLILFVVGLILHTVTRRFEELFARVQIFADDLGVRGTEKEREERP
jgi:glycosyltransferase involved in cell wall biosynthesis